MCCIKTKQSGLRNFSSGVPASYTNLPFVAISWIKSVWRTARLTIWQMKEAREYKQTELGLLPEGWEVAKLGI